MKTGQLRAGLSEVELKPMLGLATGDGAPQAKGQLTPLYVKALALSNGYDEVAVVTLDMLGIDRPDAIRAAELTSQRCGIPAHSIMLTCSHTHVAPSMLPSLHTYRAAFNPHWDERAVARERVGRYRGRDHRPGGVRGQVAPARGIHRRRHRRFALADIQSPPAHPQPRRVDPLDGHP
jgi:hypothetical protein